MEASLICDVFSLTPASLDLRCRRCSTPMIVSFWLTLQEAIYSLLYSIYRDIGLVINSDKTEKMFHLTRVALNVDPVITIGGAELRISPQFNYLGLILTADCSVDEKVDRRINKASASFGRIRKRVFDDHGLRRSTKVVVYRAMCLQQYSMVLNGGETLTLYRRHLKLLEGFYMRCIKKILGTVCLTQ